MKGDNKILFSERFQELYDLLGVFSYIYVHDGSKGIAPETFSSASNYFKTNSSAFSLLKDNGILYQRDERLHLDRRRFYTMTVWDLLVIAEPWLEDKPELPEAVVRCDMLRNLGLAENLSMCYTGHGT
ncbi:MAG: hypothetical protein LUE26_11415 [Alistipes sp.]|nr:hypothetical protein [Alistipes sp.]